ncbi:SDR family NAD(P)-dependent oxidoreductase [Pelosinus baikalensis]|uniref:SDR family NAD(P)-dependent oxidoreductase n=1 Tax=Pelosinus baikalensis TaxID=2892015 RepID=A0ABS8HUS7_9FIRM|nr:SDR family NAD(P)-dependent oxidoreductase [Pelosinus baikalensis]MCC5466707.1 SDR family NAD(P)-dependent oxidoreductase [Pelosinus baikalensis]
MNIERTQKKTFLQKINHSNFIVRDHNVHGVRTLPGVALLDMIYRLSANYLGTQAIELKQILFQHPIVTSEYFDKNIVVTFTPQESHWKVTITSQKVKDNCVIDTQHDENMECLLFLTEHTKNEKKIDVQAFISSSKQQWDMDAAYGLLREIDIYHFVFMKTQGTIYQHNNEELIKLHCSELAEKYRNKFYAHPAFLDASTFAGSSFQLSGIQNHLFEKNTPYIPFMIERFCIYQPLPATIYTHTKKTEIAKENISMPVDIFSTDITIFNEAGQVLVEFDRLTLKQIREPYLIKKLIEPNNSTAVNIREPQGSIQIEAEQQASYKGLEKQTHAELGKNKQLDSDSRHVIISYLQKVIGRVLKKSADEIDTNNGFYDLGLDSTHLIGLVKELEQKLAVQLYPTLLFEYSTIQSLSGYLLENYESAFLNANSQENEQPPDSVEDIDNSKMLFFEPVWHKQNIIKQPGYIAKKIQNLIILFDGSTAMQSEIQQNISAADVITLNSEEEHIPYQVEDKFKQLLELIQKQLQQKNPGELLIQVVADSESKYVYSLGGLLQTACLENPKVHSQIITIERFASQSIHTVIQHLKDEAYYHDRGTAEIYYKGKSLQRYVKQLFEMNFASKNKAVFCKENGVYVVTGGLGGLGFLIANHIASQAAVKLVLIGRSKLNAITEEKIRQLMQKGAEVLYLEANISKRSDVVHAFASIKDKFGSISGIFHSAGVLKDQVIIQKNLSEIQDVFNPKIRGLWHVDEVTQDENLDFFVMFSSISAITGNIGQSDYSTANAFMDNFAIMRQKKVKQGNRHGRTITINWPLWSEGGMHIDSGLEQVMYMSSGLKPLPTILGIQALNAILNGNNTQNIVLYGEENKIRNYFSARIFSGENKLESKKVYVDTATQPVDNSTSANSQSGDIAIIGLSGRYPMANTMDQFYQNLRNAKDCITHFPKDRWKDYQFTFDVEQFYKYGGFIDHIDQFDPLFFNIAPRQAENMDPQARLFLEIAWEAMEDAGFYQDRSKHYYSSSSDKSVGVFGGVFWSHYELFGAEMTQRGVPTSLGVSSASIPNMVSYCLNFHGPSMAVDTMCSSALTSLHLACESIRKGECHYAIAGGVNLVTHPHKYMFLKREHFLASDGRCRSFGEGGDGYVPGEGVGAVLLTSLERAEKEGYSIYGVIKGSALNHGGKTSGAMVPDPVAQSEVITDAIKMAGIDPRTISYVEAHGTGTSLGDPIEFQGLCKAYKRWTDDKQYCAIGSSKSNIGHLEAAAGIAGLTKVLLQFKHQEIFPSLHSDTLNPYIPFNDTPFVVEHNLKEWKRPEIEIDGEKNIYPRRAGLSSFGANGSNAHIIIEEYVPKKLKKEAITINKTGLVIVPLSAKNEECLKVYAQKLLDYLRKDKKPLNVISNENLEKIIQDEIIKILSKLICVEEVDIDPSQDFAEINADLIHLNTLYQNLQVQWGMDIDQEIINQSHSINHLVAQFILQYQKELEKIYIITKESVIEPVGVREINLADLAYTLQVGRESMEERLGLIVGSIKELEEKLQDFVEGKDGIDDLYRGQIKRNKEILTVFAADEDMEKTISAWINKGKYGKVLQLWVKGMIFDWNKLYSDVKPCRISLPTYPFARERYWVSESETNSLSCITTASATTVCDHPLLHKNTSDFSEQRFSSTFTGREFFLNDHVVKGRRVLPGVAYLEMARAAVEQAVGVLADGQIGMRLKNVVWTTPIAVGNQPVQIHVGLYPENNEEIAYEIYSELKDIDAEPVVHSQGSAVLSAVEKVPTLDLQYVKAQCSQSNLSANQCYETFARMGIEYGPGHQGIEMVYVGTGQVLAKLSLPSIISDTKNQFVLHPSLIDAAFQASIGLVLSMDDLQVSNSMTPPKLILPFALQELEIHSRCTADMWALVCYSDCSKPGDTVQKLDIDICDEQGNICIRIKGLSSRVLEGEVGLIGDPVSIGTLMVTPYWKEEAIAQEVIAPNYDQYLVMLCEFGEVAQRNLESYMNGARCLLLQSTHKGIEERFQTYAIQAFEEIQNILKNKSMGKTLIQIVVSTQDDKQLFAGLSGILKTAQLENPKLIGQLIEVEPDKEEEEIVEILKENSRSSIDQQIRYQGGKRYIADWSEIQNSQEETIIPWKNQGVYLITGGAGGLGLIFAKEIAHKVENATIVLSGRSPLSEGKQTELKELNSLGAQIAYRQVDVTQKEAVANLIQSIREDFGNLHGIIHSAGVIRDNFIFKKTNEELQEVLAPKVAGLVNLDQASKDLPLDFFIFFSSGAGVMGNIGQADYAAANAFMDNYAKYRNTMVRAEQRRGRTLSINWPLWKDGGMRVDGGTEDMLMQSMGMVAMQTSTGIRALYQGLASGKDQVMVMEGDTKRFRAALLRQQFGSKGAKNPSLVEESNVVPGIGQDILREKAENYFKKLLSSVIKLPAHRIEADAPLENYGIDSVMVMQLTNQLEKTFGSLSKTLFFEYQTIKELTEYFLQSYRDQLIDSLGIEEKTASSGIVKDSMTVSGIEKTLLSSRRRSRFASLRIASQTEKEKEALDIAIIGVSGRYPQAGNIGEFWNNLRDGKDCITEIPKERWDYSLYFDEDKNKAGKTYSKWGGFIDDVDKFDPLFFNISPRDAEIMDPQERLFLECVYETLEDAGYTREVLGSYQDFGLTGNIGVYVGAMYEEYQLYGAQEQIQGRPVTVAGNPSSIANRVSYFCNFHGPSMAVDTMCSSSLTAIHLACQSLQRGGCKMAIAGGVNVSIHPNKYLLLAQGKFVSSKGLCESFGQGGDGYVPGEGVGAVLLKPLSVAIADGDHIYGIIKGTAVNHGGKTNGYTVPNPNAQASVIGQAIKETGINPRTISYIEAHGTGTSLGDPIEIAGLTKTLEEYTQDKQFCAIGSAKSNIGHCESAAGIAGVTKVLLQLKHRQLAPSLHSEVLNPNIDFENTPFIVQQELTEWKRPVVEINGESKEYPRIAGISSFGAGGSNAHVVIAEYIPDNQKQPQITTSQSPAIIVLSAKNEDRLKVQAQQLLAVIREQQFTDASLSDMAYTFQVGREAMEERLGLIVGSIKELIEKLEGFVEGRDDIEDLYRGQVKRNKEALAIFTADEEMQEAINKWIQRRKYAKFLDLWVKGLNFDWSKLYGDTKPQRISLPTYPFAKERYWVPEINIKSVEGITRGPAVAASIHPLLHQNTSTLSEQRFSSTFTGQESFLTDYVVKGERILPGVAFLEMARAAVEQAAEDLKDGKNAIQLTNVVWAQPVIVGDQPVQVHIGLFPEENGEIAFEIYSNSETIGREPVIHSQGSAILCAIGEVPAFDLKALQAECSQIIISSLQCSDAFRMISIDRSPGLHGIEAVYVGAGKVLAKVSVPCVASNMGDQFVLDPSLMDYILQASVDLMMSDGNTTSTYNRASFKPMLPFSLQGVEILGKLSSDIWVIIRCSNKSVSEDQIRTIDIDLCDEQGNVCIRMKGFSSQVLEGEMDSLGATATFGTVMFHGCWQEQAVTPIVTPPIYEQHLVILCEPGDANRESIETQIGGVRCLILESEQQDIAERFQAYAGQVFEKIQSILKDGCKGKVLIQIVIPTQNEQQLFSGLSGLLKTAQLENPKLIGQLIEVDPGEEPDGIIRKIKENAQSPRDNRIRYQDGKRWICGWSEVEPLQEEVSLPWKDQGIYLITGGAGGLGFIFAKEIAHKVKDAILIITGRSLLNEDKIAQLKEFEALGTRIEYRQVDVTQEQEVAVLLQDIQEEFGSINGIIHSAGVISDNFILKKTNDELQKVLAPKVKGLVNIDQASKDLSLDFLVCFSSVAGAMGNPGQADYALANAFMDAYATYRNTLVDSKQRHGRTLSINWPLWKDGGMHINEETKEVLMKNMGIIAMNTSSGIRALYQALASGNDQVMVVEGDLHRIKQLISMPNSAPLKRGESSATGVDTSSFIEPLQEKTLHQLKVLFRGITKLNISRIDADEPLESYGIDSIMITNLNQKLAVVFGELSKTLFYEYQTLGSLAEYFIIEHPQECMKWTGLVNQVQSLMEVPSVSLHLNSKFPVLNSWKAEKKQARTLPTKTLSKEDREPVAIIGISGRYPQAKNLKEYWGNLEAGKDCITEIPQERWSLEGFFHPDPQEAVNQGKSYSKWGGFVEGFADFDPLFFNISPREALSIDPQERLFIESCWEVFEDAGYTKEQLTAKCNNRVGVFAGITKTGFELYGTDVWKQGERIFPRTSFSSVANRISYLFNLKGPSMPIDTMCSSSLTAIHEACEHMYRGECEMAIAGGVNLYLHPSSYTGLCGQQMLSVDGQCKSFGEGSNGFVAGEGVGAVLLKPLSNAIADGDNIYAVIRSTSINHGGKTNGYTVPNPNAQGELIRAALDKVGINARTVSYIEAHGTGTKLGDPIEITGLTQAFRKDTPDTGFCAIGSVKTNIGHLEASAGIAGVTKIILQMKNQKLVSSLHAKKLNPNINFAKTPFVVQQDLAEWKRPVIEIDGVIKEYPRIAGISSFGAGGANAHIVIEEYIPKGFEHPPVNVTSQNPAIIVLSAKNEERLYDQAQHLLVMIEEQQFTDSKLADMAFTLQVGREAMEERLGLIVGSIQDLVEKLKSFVTGKDNIEDLYRGQVKRNKESMAIFAADEDMAKIVEAWVSKRKYEKILDLWVKGLIFDWNKLHRNVKHRRISLPTYPFAKQRYWITGSTTKSSSTMKPTIAVSNQPLQQPNAASDLPKQPVAQISLSKPASQIRQAITLLAATNSLSYRSSNGESKKPREILLRHLPDPQIPLRKPTSQCRQSMTLSSASSSLSQPGNNDEFIGHVAIMTETLQDELTTSLAETLYLQRSDVDVDQNFVEMGLDSIIGVEWIKAVNKQYGTFISATEVYDYPNIRQFTEFLASELNKEGNKIPSSTTLAAAEQSSPKITLQSSELLSTGTAITSHASAPKLIELQGRVSSLQPYIAVETLREELITSLAESLYMERSDVDVDQNFVEMGLDSIIGVEWIKAVNKQYGTSISATKTYDYPNVHEFAEFLASELNREGNNIPDSTTIVANENSLPKITLQTTELLSTGTAITSYVSAPEWIERQGTVIPLQSYIAVETLKEELITSLAESLYMERSDVDADQNFVEMGLDSIIGVEWIKAVNKKYGTSVSVTKAYDYPNIRDFSQFLVSELNVQNRELYQPLLTSTPSLSFTEILQQVHQGTLDIDQADQLLNQLRSKDK